jgi:hypothetical protein
MIHDGVVAKYACDNQLPLAVLVVMIMGMESDVPPWENPPCQGLARKNKEKKMKSILAIGGALLLLSALAARSPAFAIDLAYLGYWADDAQACTYHDAFEITQQGFSSREARCRTKEAHKEGNGGWVLRPRCAPEGTDSDQTLLAAGARRATARTQNGQTVTYVRCGKMTR